jgi:hypothetical protein
VTCPLCHERPATHPELIDGKPALVCLPCRKPLKPVELPPPPPSPPAPPERVKSYAHSSDGSLTAAVRAAVAKGGAATADEVAIAVGAHASKRARARVNAILYRLAESGELLVDAGTLAARRYCVRGQLAYAKRPGQRGEANRRSRLTAAQVLQIYAAYTGGEATRGQLAARFGISKRHVTSIASGTKWGHLTAAAEVAA